MKNLYKTLITLIGTLFLMTCAIAQEAPDVLVKRISTEVIDAARSDAAIKQGNQRHVLQLVEEKILPHIDFTRMTSLASGRFWREATPTQQQQLTQEFRKLLIYTYSGALSKVKDQKIVFSPLRMDPADKEVEVRSRVQQDQGEPIQLNYRMQKQANGNWKIYDVNVLGAWLVETYKNSFATEINRSGIDGLIRVLEQKNKRLASNNK